MKKVLLTSLVLFAALTTWADAKVQSGSLHGLKNASSRILVTWDYNKMLIEDMTPEAFLKEKGPEWERDYPAEVAAGESAFATNFNKKNKKYAQITDDEDAAQYEMIIHVDKFHYGSTAAAVIFGGFARGASLVGTVEIVDKATKSIICTINFDCAGKASGVKAYGSEGRRIYACEDLAKDLAKLVSKAK